jgi:hypothetical protein
MLSPKLASKIVLRRSTLWCKVNHVDNNFALQANTRLLARLNTCSDSTRTILLLLLFLLIALRFSLNSAPSLLQLPDKWLSANLSAIFLEVNGKVV